MSRSTDGGDAVATPYDFVTIIYGPRFFMERHI